MTVWKWLLMFACSAAGMVPGVLAAGDQEGRASNGPVSLRYRQVYLPESMIGEMARGYMPMRRDEFRRMLARLEKQSQGPRERVAWIESAEYEAVFTAGNLTSGSATLHVTHSGKETAVLALAPCKLAIGPATWKRGEETSPATVGVDGAGRLVAFVDASGDLQFPWALHGQPNDRGETTFQLWLPPSPLNRLTLALPPDVTPLVDHGLIAPLAPKDDSLDVAQPTPTGLRQWVVRLGGTTNCRLTIASQQALGRRKQSVVMQQDSIYRLAMDGMSLECRLQLDVRHEPLPSLSLLVDADLNITAVRDGERDLAWATSSNGGSGQSLDITLDRPWVGPGHSLTISAIGPLRPDTNWKLPGLRVQGVFWRQGTLALDIAESLELRRLLPRHAGQIIPEGAAVDQESIWRQFDMYRADAGLELVVARHRSSMVADMGTTLNLDPGTLSAHVVADLHCTYGKRFGLEAIIPNIWTVDGVDTEPGDMMDDYQLATSDGGEKRLHVQLAHPLTNERPMRLVIRAHRTPSIALAPAHFRPVRFLDIDAASRIVAVVPNVNYGLDVTGDADVTRLAQGELQPAQAARVRLGAGSIIFRDDDAADHLTIRIVRKDPMFAGEIHVDAAVKVDRLVESYQITCAPETTPVTRLLVHLSQRRTTRLMWTLGDDTRDLLRAQKLESSQSEKGPPDGRGETWEFVLRTPRHVPFMILGERETQLTSATAVSLATLPAAASQECSLTIRSLDGSNLVINAQSVKPILPTPTAPLRYSQSRARFRYDPSRNAEVIVDHARQPPSRNGLWAWNCVLQTQYLSSGMAYHRVEYLLESLGPDRLELRLPKGSLFKGLKVDGRALTPTAPAGPQQVCAVNLPPGKRYVRVELAYTQHGHGLGMFSTLTAQFPEVNVEVLARRWEVLLPRGYDPVAETQAGPGHVRRFHWSERLLGPLAASAAERPFDLFSRQDWRQLADRLAADANPPASASLFLELLGQRLAQTQNDGTIGRVTWRQVLGDVQHQAHRRARVVPISVWIDSESLSETGMHAGRAIPVPRDGTPITMASDALARANLTLAADGATLLLTNARGLMWRSGSLRLSSNQAVALVEPGSPLSVELQSFGRWESPGILPLEAWIATPAPPISPWTADQGLLPVCVPQSQQRACVVATSGDGTARVAVKHTHSIWAMAWALFLVSAGVVSWLALRRPSRLVVFSVATAVAALLVPPMFAPMTASLFLGTVCAGLVVLATRTGLRPHRHVGSVEPASVSRVAAGTAGAVVVVVCILSFARHGLCDDAAQSGAETSERNPIYQVLTPVNDQLEPVGEYDYLPLPFYDAIHRQVRESSTGKRNWLLTSANYQASFGWRERRSSLDLSSLIAVYRIELFEPRQRIEFPWPANESAVQVLEARLNGQPAELDWNAERTAFSMVVEPLGASQLELVLQPATTEDSGDYVASFPVPPVAQSRLRVNAPLDAPNIDVLSALGATHSDSESNDQYAELGPTDQLSLRWPGGSDASDDAGQLEVEQLVWLKIRPQDYPGRVILDGRFRFRTVGGMVERLPLTIDRRLHLFPLAGNEAYDVEETAGGDDETRTIWFRPREPVNTEFTIHVQFQLTDTTGFGRVPLPHIEAVADRVVRRWLAVSVGPDMDFTAAPSDALETLEAADFLAAWGEAESAPNLSYRLLDRAPVWDVATRATRPHTTCRQQLDVSVGHAALEWILTADLDTQNGTAFQHSLSVPADFQVLSLEVVADGLDMDADAHEDQTGVAAVFVPSGVTGKYRLRMHGRQPIDGRSMALPAVSLLNAEILQSRVRVYRRQDVLVDVKSGEREAPDEADEIGSLDKALGRLVSVLDLAGRPTNSAAAPMLRIRPNRPSVKARVVTSVERSNDQWQVSASLTATVSQPARGVVDRFRLEIPAEWSGPFTLLPPMLYQVRDIPGSRRRLLILQPTHPVPDRMDVEIRGTLAVGEKERARIPDIVPLDVAQATRYFVLPTHFEQQRIDWETSGLQPVPLRDAKPAGDGDPNTQAAYRVWSRPRAVIADMQRVAGEKQISLADVHVTVDSRGRFYGLASFQIEPAGAVGCTLVTPAGCQVLQVTVEGVPVALTPMAERRWHLPLSTDQLPQQLELLFRGQMTPGGQSETPTCQVPWIADFDVVRTLWTVRAPAGGTLLSPAADRYRVSNLRQEMVRFSNAANLIEAGADVALARQPQEVSDWYLPWITRLAASEARLNRYRWLPSPDHKPFEPARTAATLRHQTQIAVRLKTTAAQDVARAQTERNPQLPDVWRLCGPATSHPVRYAFMGPVSSMRLQYEPRRDPAASYRLLAVAVALAGGAALLLLARGGWLFPWFQQWPQALGVLFGLAWWLWASPSILGWLVILVSVWAAFRPPVPCQPVRESTNDASDHGAG